MTTRRALTSQTGGLTQIGSSDALEVGSGINSTGSTITLGITSGGTILGDLELNSGFMMVNTGNGFRVSSTGAQIYDTSSNQVFRGTSSDFQNAAGTLHRFIVDDNNISFYNATTSSKLGVMTTNGNSEWSMVLDSSRSGISLDAS